MNDVFRRMAGRACIAVVALLPASLSAQVLVIPSAPAVPADARGPTQTAPLALSPHAARQPAHPVLG